MLIGVLGTILSIPLTVQSMAWVGDFTGVRAIVRIPDAAIEASADTHAAAPRARSSQISGELSTNERLLLRTYTRAGFCSRAAGVAIYGLCTSIVGRGQTTPPRGLESDNVKLHSARRVGPATLKRRLQMLDEAMTSGKRRSDVLPMRFQGGIRERAADGGTTEE
jgi:hypothetical protein